MSTKVTGFDKLQKQLQDAQKALRDIDGQIGSVRFDASNPGSIEAAIHQMEAMIDQRLGRYSSNPLVAPMAVEIREQFRQKILERAASARLGRKSDE